MVGLVVGHHVTGNPLCRFPVVAVAYYNDLPGPAPENAVPMKRSLPSTPEEWLEEIGLAIADTKEAKPFGQSIRSPCGLRFPGMWTITSVGGGNHG